MSQTLKYIVAVLQTSHCLEIIRIEVEREYLVFTDLNLNILEGCRRGLSDLIRWLHFNLGEGTEKALKSRPAARPDLGSGEATVLRSSRTWEPFVSLLFRC